jgi:hypothetical protein
MGEYVSILWVIVTKGDMLTDEGGNETIEWIYLQNIVPLGGVFLFSFIFIYLYYDKILKIF